MEYDLLTTSLYGFDHLSTVFEKKESITQRLRDMLLGRVWGRRVHDLSKSRYSLETRRAVPMCSCADYKM